MRTVQAKLTAPFLGLLFFYLCGCALGPDYSRPDIELPSQFQEPTSSSADVANLPWWELFEDTELQNIIRIALAENKDLQIAAARIDASRALLGFTRADQFPRIDGSGQAERGDLSNELVIFDTKPRNNFGLFGDLSFELDLWGKLRRASEAQRAELLASEYAHRAVTISLVSEVSAAYLNILGVEDRLAVSKRTLENRKGATKIIKARFDKGVIPELDLNQAQIEEAEAAASAAGLERELRVAENSLSILLGRPPFPVVRGQPLVNQTFKTDIPSGFPAGLLERRPDVLAAEEQAKAAVARIGVAQAKQLPTFNLLGVIGLESKETGDLLHRNAMTWGIGSNFLGPIVDWGKSSSLVDIAEAESRAALQQYQQTVNQAVQEVEDSLVAVRTYKLEHESRSMQAKAAKNAAKLSRARYDEGVTSYLEVLDIERSLFQAELDQSTSLENYFASIVQLYKALGGGWSEPGSQAEGTS